ncbi:Gfo/Idh/MocA family protein [Aureibacillus halotolerans]|uniref:Putative dehydrogenase n=1 Tax=Aureibacillus halotolerans TaxID=1508390 RepID=A0A4R6UAT1_9BACI|nr:Gfo/Idh/MocA family oxidoreductase [Aureibacillus halotolerans]TDQ42163.1 putative dehydrogenase [Aureibacillus halotolerans]
MTVRLGVSGVGGISHLHFRQLADIDEVTVTALSDPNGASIAKAIKQFPELDNAQCYSSYEDMLQTEQLDAILLCSPHTLHFSQAMAALDAGCHVLIEKPMTCSSDEAATLCKQAKAVDKVLQVSYQRHFMPIFQYVKEALTDGTIGELTSVNASLYQHWMVGTRNSWRQTPSLSGGGMLMDSGSHIIDVLLWTTNMTPGTIRAHISQQGSPVEIDSHISLQFEEGPLANIAVIGHAPMWDERFVFCGTKGAIIIDNDKLTLRFPGNDPVVPELPEQVTNQDKSFIDAILGKHDVVVPGEFAEKVVTLTEAIYQAAGYDPTNTKEKV